MRQVATQEQADALDRFASMWGHGRRPSWRQLLQHAWETGEWPGYVSDNDKGLLQQVRNTLGPSWLVRYKPHWLRYVDMDMGGH